MNIVRLKNNLNSHIVEQGLIKDISDKLLLIPNIAALKNDIELTLYVCNILEYTIIKTDNINKEELVIKVLTTVFQDLDYKEIPALRKTIKFLYHNKKIKTVVNSTAVYRQISNWVSRKIL